MGNGPHTWTVLGKRRVSFVIAEGNQGKLSIITDKVTDLVEGTGGLPEACSKPPGKEGLLEGQIK